MANGDGLLMPGFESKTALIGNVRIHYWHGGKADGSPVLLWHGFLGTAYSWRHVMIRLAEAGYAVLAPDRRAMGIPTNQREQTDMTAGRWLRNFDR